MEEPEIIRDVYPRQKLMEALDRLAASPDPLRERLIAAMSPLIQLDEIHFDDRARWVELSAIRDRMSAIDAPHARVAKTASTMTEAQMLKMADAIVSLAAHYILGNDRA